MKLLPCLRKKSSYTFTPPYPFISTLVGVFLLASSFAFPLVPVDLRTAQILIYPTPFLYMAYFSALKKRVARYSATGIYLLKCT
jgi:hypothetical protein